MKDRELEKLLADSRLSGSEMPQNKEALKSIFLNLQKPYKRRFTGKIWQIATAFTGALSVVAAFFLVIEDNNQSGPTNNLGGIWCTYSDSIQGGSSTVWPPISNLCQNLFVKSSPGYGDKGYAVRITGESGNSDSSFLGVKTYLSERAACPRCMGIDLRMYQGIRFKMKGTAGNGKLLFIIPHEAPSPSATQNSCINLTGYHDYQVDITSFIKEKWTDVKLVFRKDFAQPAGTAQSQKVSFKSVLEDANLIEWCWKGENDQKIDLWIDNVELF